MTTKRDHNAEWSDDYVRELEAGCEERDRLAAALRELRRRIGRHDSHAGRLVCQMVDAALADGHTDSEDGGVA